MYTLDSNFFFSRGRTVSTHCLGEALQGFGHSLEPERAEVHLARHRHLNRHLSSSEARHRVTVDVTSMQNIRILLSRTLSGKRCCYVLIFKRTWIFAWP